MRAFCLLLGLLLATPAHAESPLGGVSRFVLANGLEVLLYRDTTAPKVVVVTWIRAGSRDEDKGRTGFAHLFEHLMFKGTKAIGDGRMDAILEEAGGFSSAFTSTDMTVYWEDAASNFLETILWIEADRLATLVDDFDPAKLANQQDVVRNEKRFSYDNTPYARAYEPVQEALWPPEHGYHWLTIGSHEDLQAARVDDVVKFFKTYYVASNATMVIAGDFDPAQAKALVEKHLGKLAKHATPKRRTWAAPLPLSAVVTKSVTDQVQVPRVHLAWRGPGHWAADEAAASLIMRILGGGKSSRLYQRLVQRDRLAQDVAAIFEDADFGGTFRIEVTAKPGVPVEKLNAAVLAEVAELAKNPPSGEELERAKNVHEAVMLTRLESLRDRAIQIAAYQVQRGKPDAVAEDLARFRAVTPADVQKAAAKWLQAKSRVDMTVLPEAK
jgi:zinc protease